jgi:uncharacterized protein (TIGR00369 family)
MESLNEQIMLELRKILPNLKGVEIPPKIFLEMEAEFIDWNKTEKSIIVRFPVKERYRNPLGMMQGGMIVAAIDNAFGPLSYLVAPPSLTMQMNTTYVKGVSPEEAYIDVSAQVEHQTRRFLYMTANVTNKAGDLLAFSHASCMILRGPRS